MGKKKIPTYIVVIVLICYFPVGIFMLIYNAMHSSSQQAKNSMSAGYVSTTSEGNAPESKRNQGMFAKVLGWILLVLGVIVLLSVFSSHDWSTFMFFLVLFVFGGIFLINLGGSLAKKEKRRQQYVRVINNSYDLSIASIAKQVKRSEDAVVKDLTDMLSEGYFPNCYVDQENMQFRLPRIKDASRYDYRTVAVMCKSCGAKTILLAGTVKRCEYCGSPLTADEPKPVQAPPPMRQTQASRYIDPFM